MSRGHNKGSGQHRKPGDWVRIASGRANVRRDDHASVRCPHGGPHWVPSKHFLSHLNTCRVGLARVT
jgi:hypothetical protein